MRMPTGARYRPCYRISGLPGIALHVQVGLALGLLLRYPHIAVEPRRPRVLRTSISSKLTVAIVVALNPAFAGGATRGALRLLAELKRRRQSGYIPAGEFVNACLEIGDKEQTFFWLEQGYRERSNIMMFLKVQPFFDPVRDDPAFKTCSGALPSTNSQRRAGSKTRSGISPADRIFVPAPQTPSTFCSGSATPPALE